MDILDTHSPFVDIVDNCYLSSQLQSFETGNILHSTGGNLYEAQPQSTNNFSAENYGENNFSNENHVSFHVSEKKNPGFVKNIS